MNFTNEEYTALQWALGEAIRQLTLSKQAFDHNPNHEPYKRDVEIYSSLCDYLEGIIKKIK